VQSALGDLVAGLALRRRGVRGDGTLLRKHGLSRGPIHSYRHRWGDAPGDPAYDALEARFADPPQVAVPTTLLHGADDGATLLETSGDKESYFTAGYTRHVFFGVGHCVQRERPEAVVEAILERATAG
jgi:pimeloyl-ACP methyl ester carboxylesterase